MSNSGEGRAAGARAPVSSTLQHQPRVCWVCFEGDLEEDQGGSKRGNSMVSPCLCRGSTQWVHQKCIQRWIDSKQQGNTIKKVQCPQCQYTYRIYAPPSNPVLLLLRVVDSIYTQSCPFACMGIICGSIYTACWTYGACTFVQVVGGGMAPAFFGNPIFGVGSSTAPRSAVAMMAQLQYSRAVKMLLQMDSLRFYVTLPLIPVALLLPQFVMVENVDISLADSYSNDGRQDGAAGESTSRRESADSGRPSTENVGRESSEGRPFRSAESSNVLLPDELIHALAAVDMYSDDDESSEGRTDAEATMHDGRQQMVNQHGDNANNEFTGFNEDEDNDYDSIVGSDELDNEVSTKRIVTALLVPTFATTIGNLLFGFKESDFVGTDWPATAWQMGAASIAASVGRGLSLRGVVSFPTVENPVQRALLGGIVYLGVTRVISYWMKSDRQYRNSLRKVLSFSESEQ